MRYLAVIGDICGSREVEDRAGLQAALTSVLQRLNRKHGDALASPLTITLGDEFQGLLTRAAPLWSVVAEIQAALLPVKVRFGVGVGQLDTPVNPDMALGMDGPAFHLAREAVEVLKADGGLYRVGGLVDGALANASLELVAHSQEHWQENRFHVYRRFLEDEPVQTIAEALKISKTAVYKNINDGALGPVSRIQQAIASDMDAVLGEAEDD